MDDKHIITSIKNPIIKSLVKLKDKRERDTKSKFLIEGIRETTRAIEFGYKVDTIFYCSELFKTEEAEAVLLSASEDIEKIRLSEAPFKRISYRANPEGIVSLATQKNNRLIDIDIGKVNPLYIIAESIEKPGNLGAILRSADAVGADAILLTESVTDIYNPNVLRASTGAFFSVPVITCKNDELIEWLHKENIAVLAATPHTKKIYTEADMTKAIAIAVGAEHDGLSDFWLKRSTDKIKIPMLGDIDSLNVTSALTVLLYEAVRQRNL